MEREIKFRAWDSKNKKMLSASGSSTGDFYYPFGFQMRSKYQDYQSNSSDLILMQFTGLKDKNGVEIYEGDRVNCFINGEMVGNTDVVEFKDAAFLLRYRTLTLHSWLYSNEKIADGEFEVIGNIYENPELLTD